LLEEGGDPLQEVAVETSVAGWSVTSGVSGTVYRNADEVEFS